MDRFLAPQSPEALAHSHLTENWFSWDTDHPSLDETLIAGCAAYEAFKRYLAGADLYLMPQTKNELESVLRRYAYDTIHNTIARARSPLERGGYSRVCHLAEESIAKVLNENDNANHLLELHRPNRDTLGSDMNPSPARSIRIK
ncbi:hypothetical protein OBBRIDRAFT_789598 [Obba rivulosa]|uniref:Uncharacterized protein n=1 Tax=Obba rivulosa TaxID=1052685 RepID=A0A8E2J3V2_9APHY|nr:hypothetical protein OBBRIDRAFT_789598 [Obba rivulosa]